MTAERSSRVRPALRAAGERRGGKGSVSSRSLRVRPAQQAEGERRGGKGSVSPRSLRVRPAQRAAGERRSGIEVEFFRFLNRWLEPQIRAGLGSPRLAPGGLIVLETRGRKTGRRTRVPLVATRIQGHVLIATFRGGRSQWAKNLAANPETRFWMRGKPRPAEAYVLTANRRPRPLPKLPALLRLVVVFLTPYTRAGWSFAILAPRRAPRAASKKKKGARAEGRGRQSVRKASPVSD